MSRRSIALLVALALLAQMNRAWAADTALRQWLFRGFASEEYRFVHATPMVLPATGDPEEILPVEHGRSETDHDLRLFLNGSLSESGDHFAADLSMGIWADLNGQPAKGQTTGLGYVDDAYSSPGRWNDPYDVYSLYAEYHSNGALALARGGRQTSEYGRPVTFDGASLKLRAAKPYLDLAFFGGRTVHFFKLDDDIFEDWLAAAAAVIRPLPSLRIELDYRFAAEDTIEDAELRDHSYGLGAWWRITDFARLRGYLRGLDNLASNAGGAMALVWDALGLGLEAGADAQLIALRQINERDNAYFEVLGESLPHVIVRADLWKDFDTRDGLYSIHAGWNGRMLTRNDPTAFNRDFGRAYLLFEATDIGVEGPFASLVGEYHYVPSEPRLPDNSLFTAGGSVGYDRGLFRGELGSYYYRYKYDYYIDIREWSDVRDYFAEFRCDPLKWLSIRLRYEYEQFDRDIHTVTLKLVESY